MATSEVGARLTEAHRLSQVRLGALAVEQVRRAWPVLTGSGLADWLALVEPIVRAQRRASARLAGAYVSGFRAAELGTADPSFRPVLTPDVNSTRLRASLTVTGPVAIRQKVARGKALDVAMGEADVKSSLAAMRHVLNGGRETIIATTTADDKAHGWARVLRGGDSCAFCATLAARGPVYAQEAVDFHSHDSCKCSAEPTYSREADWPSGSRQAQASYDEAQKDRRAGESSVNAFRRHLAGR